MPPPPPPPSPPVATAPPRSRQRTSTTSREDPSCKWNLPQRADRHRSPSRRDARRPPPSPPTAETWATPAPSRRPWEGSPAAAGARRCRRRASSWLADAGRTRRGGTWSLASFEGRPQSSEHFIRRGARWAPILNFVSDLERGGWHSEHVGGWLAHEPTCHSTRQSVSIASERRVRHQHLERHCDRLSVPMTVASWRWKVVSLCPFRLHRKRFSSFSGGISEGSSGFVLLSSGMLGASDAGGDAAGFGWHCEAEL
jgi:hypothetical protein